MIQNESKELDAIACRAKHGRIHKFRTALALYFQPCHQLANGWRPLVT